MYLCTYQLHDNLHIIVQAKWTIRTAIFKTISIFSTASNFSGFSPLGNFRDQTISKNIKSTVAYFIVVIKLFKSLRVNGIVIVFTEPQASTDSELYLKKRRLFSPIGEQSVQTSIAFVFLTHRIMMTEHPTNLTDTL